MVKKTLAILETEKEDIEPAADEVGVAAVNRALMILDCFTADEAVLSLAVISKKTGLYKSTILRLVQSLEAFGYINRMVSGSYVLGAAPIKLASVASKALHPAEKIMPVLRELAQATNASASFYVRVGGQRLCAYRVDSPRSIRDNVQAGQLLALDRGAGGHVLTDFDNLSAAALGALAQPFMRVTRGERDSETAAVACPVFGVGNKLEGALSLSGPLQHFDAAAVAAMAPHILAAARLLTTSFFGDAHLFES
jgi:DNA-binding IclR family transcriptional regulator